MPERQMDRIERRMDGVEERLDGLTADVSVLKTDVQELKADVSVLKVDVGELKTNVGTLTTAVSDLKQDVASLHRSAVRHESMHHELRTVAEAVVSLGERLDRGFRELREEMRALVAPIRDSLASHSLQLQDHERRISSLE